MKRTFLMSMFAVLVLWVFTFHEEIAARGD